MVRVEGSVVERSSQQVMQFQRGETSKPAKRADQKAPACIRTTFAVSFTCSYDHDASRCEDCATKFLNPSGNEPLLRLVEAMVFLPLIYIALFKHSACKLTHEPFTLQAPVQYYIILSPSAGPYQEPSAPAKSSLEVASGSLSAPLHSASVRVEVWCFENEHSAPGLGHELLMRWLFLQHTTQRLQRSLQAGSPLTAAHNGSLQPSSSGPARRRSSA